eukprot:SM000068S20543  [mRNA]  locus=s68:73193:78835:- [translate_table: standard]
MPGGRACSAGCSTHDGASSDGGAAGGSDGGASVDPGSRRRACSASGVLGALRTAELTGRGCRSLRQLPPAVYARVEATSHGMAPLVLEVERSLAASDCGGCTKALSAIATQICEISCVSFEANREAVLLLGGDTLLVRALFSMFPKPRQAPSAVARSLGFLRALPGRWQPAGTAARPGPPSGAAAAAGRPVGSDALSRDEVLSQAVWNLRNECLGILRELCSTAPALAEVLASKRDFVVHLFVLMGNATTFDNALLPLLSCLSRAAGGGPAEVVAQAPRGPSQAPACLMCHFRRLRYLLPAVWLAEEILGNCEETLDLRAIPNFTRLVTGFTSRQLAFFCRVLAMVVFEPEDRSPDVVALQRQQLGGEPLPLAPSPSASPPTAKLDREPHQRSSDVADANHDVILHIDEVLPRLVKLLRVRRLPQGRQLDSFEDHLLARLHMGAAEGGLDWQPLLGGGPGLTWEELDAVLEEEDEAARRLAQERQATAPGPAPQDAPSNRPGGTDRAALARDEQEGGRDIAELFSAMLGTRSPQAHQALVEDSPAPAERWPGEADDEGDMTVAGEEARRDPEAAPAPAPDQGQVSVLGAALQQWQAGAMSAVDVVRQGWQGLTEGRAGDGGRARNGRNGRAGNGTEQLRNEHDANRAAAWLGAAADGRLRRHREPEVGQQPGAARDQAPLEPEGPGPANAAAAAARAGGERGRQADGPIVAEVMVFAGNPPRFVGQMPIPPADLGPAGVAAINRGLAAFMQRPGQSLRTFALISVRRLCLEALQPAFPKTGCTAPYSIDPEGLHQVEVLFVLCALCGGKRKEAVQDSLASLGLIAALNQMFDKLDWDAPPPPAPDPHVGGIHGIGCNCNSQSALKIQYLRLVHNLCDRDGYNRANKLLMCGLPADFDCAAGSSPGEEEQQLRAVLAWGDGPPQALGSAETLPSRAARGWTGSRAGGGDSTKRRPLSAFGRTLPSPVLRRAESSSVGGDRSQGGRWAASLASHRRRLGGLEQEELGSWPAGRRPGKRGAVPPQWGPAEGLEKGLIVKIAEVLMREPADSFYRFWLASCIEAFLRGSDPRDQAFMASTGLMSHLVDEILKGAYPCAASLQINFDLLGELVKFNPVMFLLLMRLLPEEKFDRFIKVMVTQLVDSNVFIRSVMLSLEFFRHGAPGPGCSAQLPFPQYSSMQVNNVASSEQDCLDSGEGAGPKVEAGCSVQEYQGHSGRASLHGQLMCPIESSQMSRSRVEAEECKLSVFIRCNSVRLLQDLMAAIHLGDINQDNICVLNTALIFFVFAERHGQLAGCLQMLREEEKAASASIAAGETIAHQARPFGRVLGSFRSLLDFWREYYLRKRARDCASLEFSTNVPFSEWLRVVELLCAGCESPTSLLHPGSVSGAMDTEP